VRLKHSVKINRPIEEVFNFLGNAENCPMWMPSIGSLIVTSRNPTGVGTTGLARGRWLGCRIQFTFVYDTYEPPYRLAGHAMSGWPDVQVWSVFQSTNEATVVRSSLDITLPGPLKAGAPLIVIPVKVLLWRGFNRLRSILETAIEEPPEG
jgi:uncharacterized protein YndB with AHSA1/START domain